MPNVYQKLETAANVAILLVSILVISIFSYQLLSPTHNLNSVNRSREIQIGTPINLAGAEWEKSEKTLVLVLSSTCRFCSASLPFYRRIAEIKAHRSDVRMIAVLPQGIEESAKYIGAAGVTVDSVLNAQPSELHANGTPTLILADDKGEVVDSWVGKLPPEKEQDVLSAIFGQRTALDNQNQR